MKSVKNIFSAFILNLIFSIFELIGGLYTGSIAIFSDAFHDFGDALSIGISYFLEKKSERKPDDKYTYGYVRYSVMGSLIMTIILITGSILVIWESIKRIINPVTINYNGMLLIALIGFIINLFATYFTKDGNSLNEKVVNLHLLEDVLGWFLVLIGAILMKLMDISLLDPILSLIVALFILISAFKNIKTISDLFLEKIPNNIDIKKIKKEILSIEGINDVHHIHIRSINGINNFATMHIVCKKYNQELKNKVKELLKKENIEHSTIEMELIDEDCQNKKCKIGVNN